MPSLLEAAGFLSTSLLAKLQVSLLSYLTAADSGATGKHAPCAGKAEEMERKGGRKMKPWLVGPFPSGPSINLLNQ